MCFRVFFLTPIFLALRVRDSISPHIYRYGRIVELCVLVFLGFFSHFLEKNVKILEKLCYHRLITVKIKKIPKFLKNTLKNNKKSQKARTKSSRKRPYLVITRGGTLFITFCAHIQGSPKK